MAQPSDNGARVYYKLSLNQNCEEAQILRSYSVFLSADPPV